MRIDPKAPLPSFAPGSVIAGTNYRVVRCLGEGGMGAVYEVVHLPTGERRALKILRRIFVDNPAHEERFMLEVRALEKVSGARHIVRVFESGCLPSGRPYYVMALVEGETLHERLKRGPLALVEAIILVHQLLVALQAVHREGIVHRDVKPSNIIISPEGEVTLLDFGLVKALTENGLGERLFPTEPGFAVGTGPYMPPELIYDLPPDERGDLYAAGVVLFECLAGRLPYPSVLDENYRMHVACYGFPSLSEAGVPMPLGLERVEYVARRATNPNPDARYQTAETFATILLDAVPPLMLAPTLAAPRSAGAPPSVALRPLPHGPRPAAPPATTDPIAPIIVAPAAPAPALVAPRPPRPAALWAVPVAFASLATGVAAVLAVMGWPGPPAPSAPTVRAIAEPRVDVRPDARAGAAPAVPAVPATPTPRAPHPADVRPPASLSSARPPSASASATNGDAERIRLEAKVQAGRATVAEANRLAKLCSEASDDACFARATAYAKRKGGP
jgi:eukaryotic-like serine/threonine-protein kinase